MTDVETLTEETCTQLLSVACLRAICRARGFSPPGGGKDALARFVAPRLLETTGAARAAATLEPTWARTLHGIAMAEEPLDLRALLEFARPGATEWDVDFRAFFKQVSDGLLGSGLVLLQDRPSWSNRYGSRFERFVFHLPDVHRAALPPYPVETTPLGETPHRGDPASFCRSVLQAACGGETSEDGLRKRVASALVVGVGPILLGSASVTTLARFHDRARRLWAAGGKRRRTALMERPTGPGAFEAAAHILAHLPPGEGVTEASLRSALSEIGRKKPKKALDSFLADGVEAGFLVRGDSEKAPVFRSADDVPALESDEPLSCRAVDGGVRVRLASTGLDALLSLATVCRATPRGRDLELVPDEVLLGRRAKHLATMPALDQARAASKAFERAASRAAGRHGTLLLHEGLLLLRVEDVGLRAVLERGLGSALRPVTGAFLAVPRGLQAKVEKLAAKEGFPPRRVS